jgi:hypothetical protein
LLETLAIDSLLPWYSYILPILEFIKQESGLLKKLTTLLSPQLRPSHACIFCSIRTLLMIKWRMFLSVKANCLCASYQVMKARRILGIFKTSALDGDEWLSFVL